MSKTKSKDSKPKAPQPKDPESQDSEHPGELTDEELRGTVGGLASSTSSAYDAWYPEDDD